MFMPKIESIKGPRYKYSFKFSWKNIFSKKIFQKRQGWRLAFYLKKLKFKSFFLYLLFNWHSAFDVIKTPVYTKDIMSLTSYDYDIRAIFKENAIKWSDEDKEATDLAFIRVVETIYENSNDTNRI